MFWAWPLVLWVLAVHGLQHILATGVGNSQGQRGSGGSGLARYSGDVNRGRPLLSPPLDDVLVVGKLDGTLTAVELQTGQILWSFDSGTPLVSSGKRLGAGSTPVQQVFPGADGTLYRVQRGGVGAKIERLAVTVPELVANSPSLTDDGSTIFGSQTSTVFYVDIESGELLHSFSNVDAVGSADHFGAGKELDSHHVLAVGRRDYVVQSVTPSSVQWNVSYSEMYQLDRAVMKDEHVVRGFLEGKTSPHNKESSPEAPRLEWRSDFSLHARDATTGWEKWSINFLTLPVLAYTLKGGGQDVLPLWSANMALSPGQSMPTGDLWAKRAAGKDELVLIGAIEGGGLYAVPVPPETFAGGQNEQQEILSTAVVPLEDTSQWKMVHIEEGRMHETDSLSCFLGIQTLDATEMSVPWLPKPTGMKAQKAHHWGFLKMVVGAMTLVACGAMAFKMFKSTAASKLYQGSSGLSSLNAQESSNNSHKSYAASFGSSNQSSDKTVTSGGSAVSIRSKDGATHIGQLHIGPGVLGYGAGGTVVYEGVFHSRPVAVKRLLKEFADIATNEKDILILSDEHPNLVRLFAMEEDSEFVYLALEKCQMNLSTCVNSKEGLELLLNKDGTPTDYNLKLVNDVACGLAFLHARGVVHRDIKPHNVLIKDGRAKLSDMGLGKLLVKNQSSFYSAGSGGSSGWQAPEQLLIKDGQVQRQTKSMDVFSLGCVIHYCLTAGDHPFGKNSFDRDSAILNGKPDLGQLDKLPLAKNLIAAMLESNAKNRPNMKAVLAHPFWWTKRKQLQFLIDLSDRIENEDRVEDKTLLRIFESYAKEATGGNWGARIDPSLISNLGQYRKYTYTSLRDLLRVIRNKHNHFREMSDELKELLGPIPEGFLGYFTTQFPDLLITMYKFALEHCSQDPPLDKYFPEELRCTWHSVQHRQAFPTTESVPVNSMSQSSVFAAAPESRASSYSTTEQNSANRKSWNAEKDGSVNGRVSPPGHARTSPVKQLDTGHGDEIPSDISLRPEKPKARPRRVISLGEEGRSRSGPLPPGLGLPPARTTISLAEEGRSRSVLLPPTVAGSPPRSTISLVEEGRSQSGLLPPSVSFSPPRTPISLADEGRSRSGPLPPGLGLPTSFRGNASMNRDQGVRHDVLGPHFGMSPPRGTVGGSDSWRGSGTVSPDLGLPLSKRVISLAESGKTSSGLLSPKIGPLTGSTGTRWDDVLNIITQDQKSPKDGAQKTNGKDTSDSAVTSPVAGLKPAFGNGLRTKSEPKWSSGGVVTGMTLSMLDSGELSIGSPSSRTPGAKDYSELQSPVKPRAAPTPVRPDLPVVGWEEDPDNDAFTVLNFPQRPGSQVCDFYVKTGFCKYHDRCRFDHPMDYAVRLNEDGLPMRPGQQICEHYRQTHECKFGGACKFNHPNMKPIYAGSERSASVAALSF